MFHISRGENAVSFHQNIQIKILPTLKKLKDLFMSQKFILRKKRVDSRGIFEYHVCYTPEWRSSFRAWGRHLFLSSFKFIKNENYASFL